MNDFEKALSLYYSPGQLLTIQKTRVGIAGAGGLGSNIAVCLARSGFKDFEIIDFDLVAVKNLNRQYYFLEDVGKPKVEVITERLKNINPDLFVKTSKIKIDGSNIAGLFGDRDIIFEAFDGAGSKALLLEHFGNSNKLLIFGSGMAGISNQREIKIKNIKENIIVVGDGLTDIKDAPPLAPRVTACASLMAACALEATLKNSI